AGGPVVRLRARLAPRIGRRAGRSRRGVRRPRRHRRGRRRLVTPVRRLPAVALVALLAVLPIEAWWRVVRPPVVVRMAADGLERVVWSGTVVPDGRLAVRVDYVFE